MGRFLDILFYVAATFLALNLFVGLTNDDNKPNYEARANCIAEFDYQHPERTMMDNLVIALKTCR
jgi:hypothetical protein